MSLFQILGYEIDPDLLLNKIITRFEKYYHLVIQGYYSQISTQYHTALYRTKGLYKYSDKTGDFQATILRVEDNGHLILRDSTGKLRQYAFKELTFII